MLNKDEPKFDKYWIPAAWISAGIVIVTLITYIFLGNFILTYCFNERNFGIVNTFISNNDISSAPEFISLSNKLFARLLIIISFALFYFFIFIRLFLSARKTRLIFLAALILLPQILFYMINPTERILSNHGLYRSSIVYQVMQGKIPPPDPFFSGHQNMSPWGYPWLTAQISRFLNITPYYSFALINIISLALCIVLIYMISAKLVKKQRFNNFSVIFALLGTSILTTETARWLRSFPALSGIIEYRAVPAIKKFYTINGVPPGLVFYLLCIYLSIVLVSQKKLSTAVLLFLSAVLCGFIYAPFFPALAGSLFFVLLVLLIYSLYGKSKNYTKAGIYLFIVLAASSAIILPYIKLVSSVTEGRFDICNPINSFQNLMNVLIFLGPLVLILCLLWKKHVKPYTGSCKWLVLSCFTLVPLLEYIFLHLLDNIEYKFLLLSGICFGILAGIALASFSIQKHKLLTFVIALIFTFPFHHRFFKLVNRNNRPITYHKKSPIFYEKGINLNSVDSEQQAMNEWLRKTDVNSVVIDSTVYAPIYSQRVLYTILDIPENEQITGIGMNAENIRARNGHDINIYNKRQDIIKSIYGYSHKYSFEQIKEILIKEGKFFILVRNKPDLCEKLKSADFIGVFKSDSGKYQIFSPG